MKEGLETMVWNNHLRRRIVEGYLDEADYIYTRMGERRNVVSELLYCF
jgi:hypothetical protein